MKMQFKSIGVLALAVAVSFASCKKQDGVSAAKGDFDRSSKALFPDTHTLPTATGTISGVITSNITLTNDKVWFIDGPTFVDSLATITIQPGTYIKGKATSTTTSGFPSYLVIRRGGKIDAQGTTANPIVFTSAKAAGQRAKGDWGGVVLLGNAPTNQAKPQIEGIPTAQIPASLLSKDAIGYGGSVEADNSGILKNVRIEFAGVIVDAALGNELNGLTLGGVGAGTTLDHIQVSYGADDAFEFFGGSVNAKYLISYGNDDDDLDFDQGYQGSIQFAVAAKDLNFTYSSSPNGIESNNISSPITTTGGAFASRLTQPVLSNLTFVGGATAGPTSGIGHLFRVGSSYIVRNSIVMGFNAGATLISTTGSEYSNSYVHGFTTAVSGSASTSTSVTSLTGATPNNTIKLVDPFNISTPDWRYKNAAPGSAVSPVSTGANFTGLSVTHPGGGFTAFDSSNSYVGAFGSQTSTRWDSGGWASYEPFTNAY
ncbi:hypothetical protein LX99_00062 [Mucilaginibacter oryzae]|uniref:T9SS C-terminal target domain-containing protein n=1 Tax=Mucilaginibacter oryzae TaxID=468058 RepID=A0A316HN18_9SPHI|nr:hypothetical protein [Mucilaginibacter oryzae]PWK79605.1 hypothetical protein LX99_00062 [Mucilaginibacter oryzae]